MPSKESMSVAMLTTVVLTNLLDQVFDSLMLRALTAAALIVYIVVEWRETSKIGKSMLVTVLVVAVVGVTVFDIPVTILLDGVKRGAFFLMFFVNIGLLQAAAQLSPTMKTCGEYLVHQPPSRRYLMLSFGSHLCSLVLSLGALALLAGAINRTNTLSSAGGEKWVWETRRKRMAMALMRGVNISLFWSPLSIALVVTQTSLAVSEPSEFLLIGIGAAIVFLLLGWLTDKLSVPKSLRASVTPLRTTHSSSVLLRVFAIVMGIFVVAWSAAYLLGTNFLVAFFISLPLLSFFWSVGCSSGDTFGARVGYAFRYFRDHAKYRFPSYRSENSMVATAGALGVVLSYLIPSGQVAALVSATELTGAALVMVLALTVVFLGQLAIVPLISVSILASILPPPESLGVSPELLTLAFVGAWSITAQSSVFSGLTIATARLFEQTPGDIAYRWNLLYSSCGLLVLGGLLFVGSKWF